MSGTRRTRAPKNYHQFKSFKKDPQGMKDWVIEEQESICERFAGGNLERKEAFQMLVRIGFDPHEAQDLLNEAIN